MKFIITFLLFSTISPLASPSAQRQALFFSLQPQSAAEHLAFYELYSGTHEADLALKKAWSLLGIQDEEELQNAHFPTCSPAIFSLIGLINHLPHNSRPQLKAEEIAIIERLSRSLCHHSLKGHLATTEAEVIALDSADIDLSRGLLLSQLGSSAAALAQIQQYEALLDLMALHIRSTLTESPSPQMTIDAINQMIFKELHFRFPPHSVHASDIDLYTFLPSVLDSRRGVCLGVSILYLSLAQRLGLSMQSVTPPGHIYVRYHDEEQTINIETTAHGIDLPSQAYLSVNACALQVRNLKEIIGFAHFNQASVFSQKEDFKKAIACYEKARPYLPGDLLLYEFLGLHYILDGQLKAGHALLQEVAYKIPDHLVTADSMAADYLRHRVDVDGIKAALKHVDDTQESLLAKKEALEKTVRRYPYFRSGWMQLATVWLQLKRPKEAITSLQTLNKLDPGDPVCHYYLSALYSERYLYKLAWHHLSECQNILKAKDHHPKALKELEHELRIYYPKPF